MLREFPTLETTRLKLRELKAEDIPAIVKYAGNKNIAKTTTNIPHPYEEKDAVWWLKSSQEGFLNKTQFVFAIELKNEKRFIGGAGLTVDTKFERAEAGYWIAEPFWSNGYCSEALRELLRFGFKELHLNKIFATHFSENIASGKVMMKNGMIKEAELKEHVKKWDVFIDLVQYRLTKAEYERINSN